MKKASCFLLFFMLCWQVIFCQQQEFVFNSTNGLTTDNVYDVFIDKTDKIWFTTDKGVYSYNGSRQKSFGTRDGLPTLFSWNLYGGNDDKLWLINFETPFTYIKNNQVCRAGKSIKDFFTSSVVSGDEHTTYINSLRNYKTAVLYKDSLVGVVKDSCCVAFWKSKPIWMSKNDLQKGVSGIRYVGQSGKYLFLHGGRLGGGKFLKAIDLETKEERYLDDSQYGGVKSNSLTTGNSGRFIINYKDGYSVYNTAVERIGDLKPVVFFEGDQNLGGVFFDKNGHTWKADADRGLVFIPKRREYNYFLKAKANQKIVYASKLDEDVLLLVDDKKNVVLVENGKWIDTKQQLVAFNSASFILKFKNSLLAVMGGRIYRFPYSKNTLRNLGTLSDKVKFNNIVLGTASLRINNNLSIGAPKGFFKTDSQLIITTSGSIATVYEQGNELFVSTVQDSWINDYYQNGTDTFMCNHSGVFKRKNGNWKVIFDKVGVQSFFSMGRDICFITYSSKCYNLSKGNSEIEALAHYDQIKNIKNIDKRLVVLNDKDIFILDAESMIVKNVYSSSNGFLGGEKIAFFEGDNERYLCATNGLFSLPKRNTLKREKDLEQFRLDEFLLNNESVANNNIRLRGLNNQIKLSFSVNVYPVTQGIHYQYRFMPIGKWQEAKGNEIIFNNIPYDINGIELRASKLEGDDFGLPIKIKLSNPTPYYKQPLFYIILLLALLLLGYLIMHRLEKRRLKKVETENELLITQQKMLGLQMKPHFLSNIFNNLQSSLMLDDPKETSRFVQEVNQYLRQTLKASEVQYISLAKELEYVKNYINLERRRISKDLEFLVENKNNLNIDEIEVPVFCLQPIIENAIWHGIQPAETEKGVMLIEIEEEKNYVTLACSDNGVGMNQSTKKGNSISLKNIDRRLSLADTNKRENYSEQAKSKLGGAQIKIYVPRKPKYYSR